MTALLLLAAFLAQAPLPAPRTHTVSPGDDVLKAINALQPGDTLQVQEGTYPPPQRAYFLSCAGTDEAPVTIEGVGTVVMQAKRNESGFTRTYGFHKPVVNVVLRNLCIEGAGVGLSYPDGLHNLTLENVEVRGCLDAAVFKGATDATGAEWRTGLTCRNCWFHDNLQGISVGGSTPNHLEGVTLTDCAFERNWRGRAVGNTYTYNNDNTDGIAIGSEDRDITVRGCTFVGHGDGGIDCKAGLTIEDCTASDNTTGFKLWGQNWPSTIRNCLATRNRNLGMNFGSYGMGSGTIRACTLADNGNEELRIGCPPAQFTVDRCIVAGNHRLLTLASDSRAPGDAFVAGAENCWWRPDQGEAVRNAYAGKSFTLKQLAAGALPVGAGTLFQNPLLRPDGGLLPDSPCGGIGVRDPRPLRIGG